MSKPYAARYVPRVRDRHYIELELHPKGDRTHTFTMTIADAKGVIKALAAAIKAHGK